MRNLLLALLVVCLTTISTNAQTAATSTTDSTATSTTETKKRAPVFRANKEQVTQAQTLLKTKGLYAGEATGKLDPDTRTALKKFQESQNIKSTGTLNRITLEKLNITLTDKQKLIPVSESSMMASGSAKDTGEKPKRAPVFRASKDQVQQAQEILKKRGYYTGEQTGTLSDETRAGLKKFQEAEKIKVTGTLNRETLEKMNIVLTDKQKAM
ncbi:MAG: peptidoglycan-binding protein [Pyrinomonadaceae bacterium]|nr:peptidoglycan-binding protein [Pyrinomonadaceae bacterium]